ncbi:MAG: type transport system permease protein [Candidatus Dependentiae bacterium]|nr:type transport system permease protein [Candidatus Dependentiae bacterium]
MVFLMQMYLLLCRHWFMIKDSLVDSVINYVFVWPFLWGISNGTFLPAASFGSQGAIAKGTELVLGMLLLQLMVGTFMPLVLLLGEREESGILRYHVMATSYAAAFFSRLFFFTLYTALMMMPFFPMVKLFIGSNLYTDQLNWFALEGFVFLASAMAISYGFCVFGLIRTMHDIEYAWSYGIEPFLWLSGMWVPVYAIAKCGVPGINWVLLCNPFAYMTEALRQLFFHEVCFAPFSQCMAVMVSSTLFFILAGYWLLKRRLKAV